MSYLKSKLLLSVRLAYIKTWNRF